MTIFFSEKTDIVFVAIDIAKAQHEVLLHFPNGAKKKLKISNTAKAYKDFIRYLQSLQLPCSIGLEATANYHKTLAYHLQAAELLATEVK